jgi:hypothetical protein
LCGIVSYGWRKDHGKVTFGGRIATSLLLADATIESSSLDPQSSKKNSLAGGGITLIAKKAIDVDTWLDRNHRNKGRSVVLCAW